MSWNLAAKRSALLISLLALILSGSGCRRDLYYWGEYEDSIYRLYLEPGKAETPEEIQRLEAQIAKTRTKGRRVPPGLHAHLGFLHARAGDGVQARFHFMAEKVLFPESTRFMDLLLDGTMKP